MPIYQINLWICELCDKQQTTTEETSPASDPVVIYPPGGEWGYVADKLACPAHANNFDNKRSDQ